MKRFLFNSLPEALQYVWGKGFTCRFFRSGNHWWCVETGRKIKPKKVRVCHFKRFPAIKSIYDESGIFIMETKNGRKGIIIDGYGAYGDAELRYYLKILRQQRQSSLGLRPETEPISANPFPFFMHPN